MVPSLATTNNAGPLTGELPLFPFQNWSDITTYISVMALIKLLHRHFQPVPLENTGVAITAENKMKTNVSRTVLYIHITTVIPRQCEADRWEQSLCRKSGVLRQRPVGDCVRWSLGYERCKCGVQTDGLREGSQDYHHGRVWPRPGTDMDRSDWMQWNGVNAGSMPTKTISWQNLQCLLSCWCFLHR